LSVAAEAEELLGYVKTEPNTGNFGAITTKTEVKCCPAQSADFNVLEETQTRGLLFVY